MSQTLEILDQLTLNVDFNIPEEEILRRGNLLPQHWQHESGVPKPGGVHVCNCAIVTFHGSPFGRVPIHQIVSTAQSMDQRLSGSGAWIREAYLAAFPNYDGIGAMIFPDAGSIWTYLLDPQTKPHMPGIWHDFGKTGQRSMDPLTDSWRDGRRIFLSLDGPHLDLEPQ